MFLVVIPTLSVGIRIPRTMLITIFPWMSYKYPPSRNSLAISATLECRRIVPIGDSLPECLTKESLVQGH
jgi:hypothetical protein